MLLIRIPDLDFPSGNRICKTEITKKKDFLTRNCFYKPPEIWSEMFIPDHRSGFLFHPGSSARIYRPSFCENKPKRSFSVIENERFGLVFAKTGSINSGTGVKKALIGSTSATLLLHTKLHCTFQVIMSKRPSELVKNPDPIRPTKEPDPPTQHRKKLASNVVCGQLLYCTWIV